MKIRRRIGSILRFSKFGQLSKHDPDLPLELQLVLDTCIAKGEQNLVDECLWAKQSENSDRIGHFREIIWKKIVNMLPGSTENSK